MANDSSDLTATNPTPTNPTPTSPTPTSPNVTDPNVTDPTGVTNPVTTGATDPTGETYSTVTVTNGKARSKKRQLDGNSGSSSGLPAAKKYVYYIAS